MAQAKIYKIPRKLTVDAVVPASGSQTAVLTVPADCDFEWDWLSLFRTNAALKMLMQEVATQRPFIISGSPQGSGSVYAGIFVDNMAGLVSNNGAMPEIVPYVMAANRQYNFSFLDSSAAPNTVQLAFHGYGLLQV